MHYECAKYKVNISKLPENILLSLTPPPTKKEKQKKHTPKTGKKHLQNLNYFFFLNGVQFCMFCFCQILWSIVSVWKKNELEHLTWHQGI